MGDSSNKLTLHLYQHLNHQLTEGAMDGPQSRPAAGPHDSGGQQRHRGLSLLHLPRRIPLAGPAADAGWHETGEFCSRVCKAEIYP